jgi:cytochrome c
VLVAYGQNGEMLRPEQGYPLRLVVPGVQGVSWVKYLRRIEVGDMPYAAKDEAIHYVDLMPDGQHRQYSSIQECKSVVTTPSGGQMLLDKGFYNITGLAWSGRGKVKRVDVSVDGGRNWRTARLEGPVMDKCLTRFIWTGSGMARNASSRAAPWMRRAMCSPATSSCVPRAARAPSITTIPSSPGRYEPTGRSPMFSLRKPLALLALCWSWAWLPGPLRRRQVCRRPLSRRGPQCHGQGGSGLGYRCAPGLQGAAPGSGSVQKGMDVWEAKCASCHGVFGESNEVFSPLVGGTTAEDIKTGHVARLKDPAFPGRTTLMKVATVSTLWDYINRAMPWNAPKSLSTEEVYAVTAYLLNLGGVVPESFTLSDTNIAEVQRKLPNRNGMTTRHACGPAMSSARRQARCAGHCLHEQLRPRAQAALGLPEHASNNHGNLAQQNRLVGAQRGIATDGGASKAASLRPPGNRAVRHRRPCWKRTPAWPAMAWRRNSSARPSATLPASTAASRTIWPARSGRRLRRLGINTHAASAQSQRC